MSNSLRWTLLGLVGAGLMVAGCKKPADEATGEKAPAREGGKTNAAPAETKSASGAGVRLDAGAQKRIGLKTAALTATQFQPEWMGYGRVLDPAPLAALAMELASARASLAASRQEYERLKTLYGQDQNASLRALQAAEAAAQHDQILLDSAQQRLVLGWGQTIAQQEPLEAFVRPLSTLETVIVRVDLLAGEGTTQPPETARLATVQDPDHPAEANYLSLAPSVDPLVQGRGFLFLLKTNTAAFRPGAAVTAWLQQPGGAQPGVLVPRPAVLRYEGLTWVFVQTGPDTFARRPVGLAQPTEQGWVATNGVSAGEQVVVEGVQTVLSEELNSASSFRPGVRD